MDKMRIKIIDWFKAHAGTGGSMQAKKISTAAHAAHLATFQAIKHGKVGIDFTCPDTCSIEWTPEGIAHVVQSIFAVDKDNVFKEWIEELLHEAGAPPEKLLKRHPEYDAKLAEFEAEMGTSPFASDDDEHRYFDNEERARDMRASL